MFDDFLGYDRFQMEQQRSRLEERYPGFQQHPDIVPLQSFESRLPFVNYNNDRFATPQVVFDATGTISEFKQLTWFYSDRLYDSDSDKDRAARAYAASKINDGRIVAFWQHYIEHYWGGEFDLKAIAAGYNHSTLYEYRVFGCSRIKK